MAQRQTSHVRPLQSKVALWEQKVAPQKEEAVFTSDWDGLSHLQSVHGNDPNYGHPKAGSRTELRGKQAGIQVSNEVVELCRMINELGVQQPGGFVAVKFGVLFEAYVRISNKLVGMLLRARKQNLVEFEGEMLFQRRDDDVLIRLVQEPEALEADIERRRHDLANHPQKAKR